MSKAICETVVHINGFEYICADKLDFLKLVAAFAFFLIIFLTVVGNALVILLILKDKKHQTPSNYLIFSLAITDLIAGLICIPIMVLIEMKDYGTWPYGAFLCDFRVVIAKISNYASILHLVAISVDRYLSVASVHYSITRNNSRIFVMIAAVWLLAFGLSIAPLFGLRDEGFYQRIAKHICWISTDFTLNLIVCIVVFIIPTTTMAILYVRIYQIAKTTLKRSPQHRQVDCGHQLSNITDAMTEKSEVSTSEVTGLTSNTNSEVTNGQQLNEVESAEASLKRRERKVATTLFVVTGCVFICWLPFFTYYTLSTIFNIKLASSSSLEFKIILWLGMLQSTLNPFIYAVMNPYYRHGFAKLLGMG